MRQRSARTGRAEVSEYDPGVGACGVGVVALAAVLLLAMFAVALPGLASAQVAYPNVLSYRVDGAVNYSDPGGEAFWSSIAWTDVPLVASIAPGGGHTSDVRIKSANDGFNVFVLFQWNDSAGPSFASNTELWRAPNGTLMPLTPADTATVKQLYSNATYYYQDRAALLWFLPQSLGRQQTPDMMEGSDGAITGGAAEIWHWQSNPTDNSPLDAGFPGGYTDTAGNPIYPANNLSFAEDDYTNMTGFFTIPGSFGATAPNLVPGMDPFQIRVGSSYSQTTKQWTVEMVRAFTMPQAKTYCVQLAAGATYDTGFAIWNGRQGESAAYKSVSQWYTLTLSNQTVAQAPAPTGGVPLNLAAAVGIGLLLVGVMIGAVVRSFKGGEGK
ncbi:MAG TPA: ethylbenzene dehydrogenase-related protein [Thermoplasmata archaeon]|nr:ethylbenzene dehydrogenase-related protein [Thermoplasmata archaeon]